MKTLSMIACVSRDRGIGYQCNLLWQIPEDMQFFRQTTIHHPVVMGGATYRSIGRPLPKRQNIVLSRRPVTGEGIIWAKDLATLERLLEQEDGEVFIIGGASLYQQFIDRANRIYLTEVDAEKPADTFFPEFNHEDFAAEVLKAGDYDGISYQIKLYRRS